MRDKLLLFHVSQEVNSDWDTYSDGGRGVNRRRLEALRNLAARPGTEAEGRLAREMLARCGSTGACERPPLVQPWEQFDKQLHADIAREIRVRFPRGSRVYYNCWAYSANCPATVVGYCVAWNWIRLKFDHLKTPRKVPVYQQGLWHLSTEPLDRESQIALRGGMEKFEDTPL